MFSGVSGVLNSFYRNVILTLSFKNRIATSKCKYIYYFLVKQVLLEFHGRLLFKSKANNLSITEQDKKYNFVLLICKISPYLYVKDIGRAYFLIYFNKRNLCFRP